MLRTALICFVLAVVAYLLGATGSMSMEMGRVVFVALLVPAVLGVSASVIAKSPPDDVL